jgi:hypothetical protein
MRRPAGCVLIGMLAAVLLGNAAAYGYEAVTVRALEVARGALERAVALGSSDVVPKAALRGATVGEVYMVHDPATLEALYALVPVVRADGRVIGLIGEDAALERVLWYRFNYQGQSFPAVSLAEARGRVTVRARALGEPAEAGEARLIRGYDKHFYWRFDVGPGKAYLVDIDRPEAEVTSSSDRAARDILVPQERDPGIGQVPGRWHQAPLGGGGPGVGPALLSRPAAYNVPGVPYHFQITDWYCGPASLQMIMDYLGEEIGQVPISDVANDIVDVGCYNDDMRRAAHFSGLSAAIQDPLLIGYAERKLGYSSEEWYWYYTDPAERLEDLKAVAWSGYPVFVLTWYDGGHSSGHFRVIKGFDDNLDVLVVHDPWYYGFSGPDLLIDQTFFNENLWVYSGCSGIIVSPWLLTPEVPSSVAPGDTFTVNLRVLYPGPYPFAGQYSASASTATIALPAGLALAGGASTVVLPNLASGDSTSVAWDVIATGPTGELGIGFQAQGTITGGSGSYPSYTDTIGGHAYETVEVADAVLLAHWGGEERLTDNAGSSQTCFPGGRAMVAGADGTVHVVWADTKDGNGEIYYRKQVAGSWQAEVRLTADSCFSDNPCIAIGPDGRLHVAWESTDEPRDEEICYKYWDPAGGWSATEQVTDYGERDHAPTLAAGPDSVYLAWQRNTGSGLHYYIVYFAVRDALGWSEPVDVDVSPERDSYRPSIAYGTDGKVHLVYERQTANAPNEKERIVYRSWDGSAWSGRTGLSSGTSYGRGAVIAAGPGNTLHVVWQDGDNIGGDIFYTRYDGSSWQGITELVTGSTEACMPSVAADATGGIHVVWVDQRHGDSEIYYIYGDAYGWDNEVRLTRASGMSTLPTVALLATGDPCVVWTDLRHGTAEVYYRGGQDVSGVAGDPAPWVDPAAQGPLRLSRPCPAPSAGEVRLTLSLDRAMDLAISIYDVKGSLVKNLSRGGRAAGTSTVVWDGRDGLGRPVASGIYFVRGSSPYGEVTRRVVLVR